MKPDRQHAHETLSLEAVEDRLRRLSAPQAPEGLEARLIAAIPTRPAVAGAPASRRWRWPVLAGLAAAVAWALFAFWPRSQDSNVAQRPSALKEATPGIKPGSLAAIDPKDFDPCNILPPLPDWR